MVRIVRFDIVHLPPDAWTDDFGHFVLNRCDGAMPITDAEKLAWERQHHSVAFSIWGKLLLLTRSIESVLLGVDVECQQQ